ncbi:unnamed protein product [Clonostachys chloroleuca]|uniref:DNA polymerase kappa n=1 Tax=Clonostachys chloroleuca TaxID=1926264 RepID=A0AA35PZY7_9HYPO|nr:unnamed protein product [Clonostachys chloroleuca]
MTSPENSTDAQLSADEQPLREVENAAKQEDASKTLKYHLLGPSLTKAGQDKVDQTKVSEIIYNASKGSKFFNREELRDKVLSQKIERILARKRRLEKLDLTRDLRNADRLLAELEATRDLSQHIVHVDCDAFYAAVEQLERPELKDVPFAVGGGVLTTCNYVARQFGCRSGMAGFVAKKLCPQLVLLKPNFQKYSAKANEVREVLVDYDPRFESASVDEAYLNITEYCREHNMEPAEVVEQMRREVHEKTQVTVSAGIAANAKLAKICSNMNKPNGQFLLPNERGAIMVFMRDLPTRKVNGIGRVLERELLEIGVKTCGDIFAERQYLYQLFGEKAYDFLLRIYLGLGRTSIQPAEEYERKSVGTERTFSDLSDPAKLREKLRSIAEELEKDMKRAECKGRTLCLKVKLHTFEVLTRQVVTPRTIHLADDLYNFGLPILAKIEQEIPGLKLRLMGLRCTHLVSTKKPDTMAFFGFRPRAESPSGPSSHSNATKRKAGDFEDGEGNELEAYLLDRESSRDDTPQAEENLSGLGFRKEVAPNPTKAEPIEEELWDCPICGRPQNADERAFNEHIDLCLSRQAIRDTLQTDVPERVTPEPKKPEPKKPESKRPKVAEKKRGRPPSVDPKQKKLFFG